MSESDINFKALKKLDPYIQRIDVSCSNVALYNFNTHKAEWEKTEVEGTLFLFEREAEPKYGFTIMNRLNPENHIEPVTGKLDFQIQPPFLLYKNSEAEIRGLWFYSSTECQKVGNRIQELVKEVEREQEARKSKKSGGEGGGGGNLTALFQKADKAMKREEALKQQQTGNSAENNSTGDTTNSSADFCKNLLRLLSQPENNNNVVKPQPTSKGETTESVNAFFAMASNNQQLRVTPQPVLNGGLPGGGVACSTVENNMMPPGGVACSTVEGGMIPPQAAPPSAPLALHQPAVFGMPAGVIQALPISQGLAMGAVPVGGFTPYPGNTGLVPATSGLTVTPGLVPGPGPAHGQMHSLLAKSAGAMTVEKLEEEQRKSISPKSRDPAPSHQQPQDGGLGDLSSKLKEQLGVKMTTSVQKPVSQAQQQLRPQQQPAQLSHQQQPAQLRPQHQPAQLPQLSKLSAAAENGPVLLSPNMFSASSPLLEPQQHPHVPQQHSHVPQQLPQQQAQSQEVRSDKEVTPLTKDQMIEAMEYLLKNDDSFVEKLHIAYVQALQQRLK